MKEPVFRFKGYTDEWEQRKLGEIATSFDYGLNAAATEYDGKNAYIRITDIDDYSRNFIREGITSPDIDLSKADDYMLALGDVLFARTGASVGKSYIYKPSDGLMYFAGFLIRARIKKEYDAGFVFQNTLTENYNRYIAITSQRSGQPGVNAQEYADYDLMCPSKDEQTQIGKCFKIIDTLITLHQRKCDALKTLKKGMLQKMFPKNGAKVPEFRFKGFTGDWEQRKLGELVSVGDIDHKMPETVDRGIPYLMTGDFCGVNELNFNGVKQISEEDYEQLSKKIKPEKGDILFARYASVGAVRYVDITDKFLISYSCAIIKNGNNINSKYLYHYLTGDIAQKQIGLEINTGSQANIGIESMKNILVDMPCHDEQMKIAAYLDSLDTLITLHQRKADALKNLKKGMLQKMFV